MKKCLWVVPKLIFPTSDGARQASQSLLQSVRPYFEKLDIIVFKEEHETNLQLELYHEYFRPNKIHVLVKPNTKRKIMNFLLLILSFLKQPSLPVISGHYSTKYCKKEVRRILKNETYDVLVFDGIHPYTAFLELESEGALPPKVYRAHHVEHELLISAAGKTSNPFKRLLLLWQGRNMALLEKNIIEKSKKVWAIGNEDQKRLREMTGMAHIHHIPVGLNFIKKNIFTEMPLHAQKIKLLFVGKMDLVANIDGLRWFFHEIWPFVDYKNLEIKIVGGGDLSWANSFYAFPGVFFLDSVQDMASLYDETDYSIFPVRFNTGTNLKIIESISHGVPVISTPMGVQGCGLDDDEYIKVTAAQEWINILNSLRPENSREKVRSAFIKFEKTYGQEMIGENAYLSLQT